MLVIRRLLILLMLLPALVLAEGEEQASSKYVEYVELNPPFVANYGGPGPLKYVKAEVSIKVLSREAEENIKHHKAQIRNNIIMLLSDQTDETLGTAAGREQLRQQCLESVRQVMVKEYGQDGYAMAADLLFTSFVVQN